MRLYPRLAVSAIKRNSRLYIPFLLSCVGMTSLYYIIRSLSLSPFLEDNTKMLLNLGTFVIGFFSLIFLCYTNSFLVKRRYREFGLYNVLGMDRHAISHVIFWENLITAAISITGGLMLGITVGKFAELGLMKVIGAKPDYKISVPVSAIAWTFAIYVIIHIILLIISLIRISKARPLELMRSESFGEKPPRANIVIAILGLMLLTSGYVIAVRIKSPLQALLIFMFAVLLVVAATYLLFTAGSVTLSRLLQKNKSYYYKKSHFISTSSMAFRMKRNGAGLASICILATMVLVTASTTTSLYFNVEDIIGIHCPMDVNIELNHKSLSDFDDENTNAVHQTLEDVLHSRGADTTEKRFFNYVATVGLLKDGEVQLDPDSTEDLTQMFEYENLWQFVFISADDYNELMGTDLRLSKGEAISGTRRGNYTGKEINFAGTKFTLSGVTDSLISVQAVDFMSTPSMMLIISDYKELAKLSEMTAYDNTPLLSYRTFYGYNTSLSDEALVKLYNKQIKQISSMKSSDKDSKIDYYARCLPLDRANANNMFGGFFFLGILLSLAFLLATVLIIYYKQISEGYEDQSRFAIMRKVGMTDKDIRQSINSQMLTVFFAPLLVAGLHLAFAFPMMMRMLQLFAMFDVRLTLIVTFGVLVVFALFYTLVYRITTRGYYRIVRGVM